MSSKLFNRNPFGYTKSGTRRRGLFTESINVVERDDPSKNDRENRKEAKERVAKLVEEGKSIDEAVAIVAGQEDIKQKFEYLTKNGIAIENVLKSMYISSITKEKAYIPHTDERGE